MWPSVPCGSSPSAWVRGSRFSRRNLLYWYRIENRGLDNDDTVLKLEGETETVPNNLIDNSFLPTLRQPQAMESRAALALGMPHIAHQVLCFLDTRESAATLSLSPSVPHSPSLSTPTPLPPLNGQPSYCLELALCAKHSTSASTRLASSDSDERKGISLTLSLSPASLPLSRPSPMRLSSTSHLSQGSPILSSSAS